MEVKRSYRYRFHPTDEQVVELSRTFGCVRPVYNRALEARTTIDQFTPTVAEVGVDAGLTSLLTQDCPL